MRKLVSILIAFLILVSCNKKPVADFSPGSGGYMAGSVVPLINSSQNAASYKWVMPDGRISTEKNEGYSLPINLDDCTLTFELTAYSKREKKSATISKSVEIVSAAGFVVFWKNATCSCGTTTVTIGTATAQITANTTTVPFCNAPNTGSFYLRIGNYLYSATDGTKTWNGNITVTRLGCLDVQLI